MNIILTSSCNKNCSFCFADEYISNKDKQVFKLDLVKDLILEAAQIQPGGFTKLDSVKLLGGEPTKYPEFIELFDWMTSLAEDRKSSGEQMVIPNLISNFLFNDSDIGDAIVRYGDVGFKFSLLLNSSEFNNDNQFDLFISNINKYAVVSDNISLTFGFTMFKDNSFDMYKTILDRIVSDYVIHNNITKNMPHIRLSMPNPEHGSVEFESILESVNTYRSLMKDFISYGKDNNMKVQFDCGLFYCLFDDELREYASEWSGFTHDFGCDSGAYDIFPNGDITKILMKHILN